MSKWFYFIGSQESSLGCIWSRVLQLWFKVVLSRTLEAWSLLDLCKPCLCNCLMSNFLASTSEPSLWFIRTFSGYISWNIECAHSNLDCFLTALNNVQDHHVSIEDHWESFSEHMRVLFILQIKNIPTLFMQSRLGLRSNLVVATVDWIPQLISWRGLCSVNNID